MTNTAQTNDHPEGSAPHPTSSAGFDRDIRTGAGCLSETLAVAPALLAVLAWLMNRESCGGADTDETAR